MRLYKRFVIKAFKMFGFDVVRIGPHLVITRRNLDHLEWTTILEPLLLQHHLGYLLKQFEVNCVLDIGANEGQYGLALRRLGYEGYIISFEPIRELYEKLQALSSNDSKWSVYQFALGSRDFSTQIQVTDSKVFSSLLKTNTYAEERFGKSVQVNRVEEVEVRRLDAVLGVVIRQIRNPRIFLKMDTQGYDLEVFSGLGEQVKRIVGLQSEVSVIPIYEGTPTMIEALMLYESHGFEITGFFPITKDNKTSRVIEYDCVMVRVAVLL